MNMSEQTIRFLATGGFVGKAGFAPGTLGSLAALPLCYLISVPENDLMAAVVIIGLILGAVWIAGKAEVLYNKKDPGCIVVDEIAGMLVTLYAIPVTAGTMALGFFSFRVFDIFKPYPIRLLDQRLRGGWGIVADDLAAGLLANITVRVLMAVTV